MAQPAFGVADRLSVPSFAHQMDQNQFIILEMMAMTHSNSMSEKPPPIGTGRVRLTGQAFDPPLPSSRRIAEFDRVCLNSSREESLPPEGKPRTACSSTEEPP